jgi:hypothetical protein
MIVRFGTWGGVREVSCVQTRIRVASGRFQRSEYAAGIGVGVVVEGLLGMDVHLVHMTRGAG